MSSIGWLAESSTLELHLDVIAPTLSGGGDAVRWPQNRRHTLIAKYPSVQSDKKIGADAMAVYDCSADPRFPCAVTTN